MDLPRSGQYDEHVSVPDAQAESACAVSLRIRLNDEECNYGHSMSDPVICSVSAVHSYTDHGL